MAQIAGKVVMQNFGTGSKSEHDAIYLDTGKKKYRIKKKGGNPFFDSSLHSFIGKRIKVKGNITPHFFEITDEPEEL